MVLLAAPVFGQTCPGDCDGNQTVSIAELIRGVDIALGAQAVTACSALDKNNNGAVTVDELVSGVDHALFGCAPRLPTPTRTPTRTFTATPTATRTFTATRTSTVTVTPTRPAGGRDSTVRESSSVAVSSVFSLLDFGQIAGGGGGGAGFGGLPRMAQSVFRAPQISGCQRFECFALGQLTGFEDVCCLSGRVEITDRQCVISDSAGNVTERNGFSAIESNDFDPCGLAIPPGSSYFSEFTDFSLAVRDLPGNFYVFAANAAEFFEANPGGCTLNNPDPLGLGAQGDGFRITDGTTRQIVGNANGVLADLSTTSSELSLDIFSSPGSGGACVVDVEVNGQVAVSDFLGGEQFSQSFDTFSLSETPLRGGDALVDLDGFTTSDCLGAVYLFTREPLRLALTSQCPTGGVLELTLPDDSVGTINYTMSGGLNLDFDDDGTIDQRFGSCNDVPPQQCELQTPQGQCTACSGAGQCGGGLVCAPCLVCDGAPSRCAPAGDFVICEDDIYGDFGF